MNVQTVWNRSRPVRAFLGFVLILIGLPSISSEVAAWAPWLKWIARGPWQLLLIFLGLAILVLAEGPVIRRRLSGSGASAPSRPHPRITEDPLISKTKLRIGAVEQKVSSIELIEAASVFRRQFDLYIDTFFERRREVTNGRVSAERLGTIRQEYRTCQREVAKAYLPVRDSYQRFLSEMPEYAEPYNPHDIELDGADVYDPPINDWWQALTFDDARKKWAAADDDHVGPFIDHQRAVLDAFQDWAAAQ